MSFNLIKLAIISSIAIVIWLKLTSIILFFTLNHHLQNISLITFLKLMIIFYQNPVFLHKLLVASIISLFSMVVLCLLFMKRSIPDIYGKAKFATVNDIKKSGLFSDEGILLGKFGVKHLRLNGYEHLTVFAPTGTGKTAGITVPNLLDWQESAVVSDIKLQLFKLTSKYRASMGQKVFLWSIGNREGITHCFNPLDLIQSDPLTRIDEVQKIAMIFIPDKHHSDPIWESQARMMFLALTLYVLDTPALPKNIASVVNVYKNEMNFVKFLKDTLETRKDLDSVCRANFIKLIEMSDKTRASIGATFTSHFELFDNPLIAAATSKSDFDIGKLRKEKMTIYVGVTNDNLVRLAPLLTVFYQQVADVMTRTIPNETEPHGVLLVMDEFSALRRMESFHKNIGLYREYKLRIIIIIQELSQLYDIYGRDGAKVFINAKVRIAFTQNDEETCKLIENLLGTKTIQVKQRSKNLTNKLIHDKSESIHYASRALMLAQEIRMIAEDKALIIMQGHPPIFAKKIAWYKDKKFKQRMLGGIEIPSIIPEIQRIIENNKQHQNMQTSESIHDEQNEQFDQMI